MTSPSKRKGSGFELEVVKLFQEFGLAAEKVPLSGALRQVHRRRDGPAVGPRQAHRV